MEDIFNTLADILRPENPYKSKDVVHFQPFRDNHNVKCLNGNFHAKRTFNINDVTCPKCLNPETGHNFWSRHEEKNGTVHKVF